MRPIAALLLLALTGPEATSLLGRPLYSPALAPAVRAEREAQLAAARAQIEAHPGEAAPVDALIWLGRRTAYLGRYREAIAIYTRALALHPDEPRLLRHRGHRHLTLRRFDLARADLERAAALLRGRPDEVEPDGLPNARGIPTSTLQSNVWYHLGLARYLQGDFEGALAAYRECERVSKNPDMLAATVYWLHLTLLRLGRETEAAAVLVPVGADWQLIENHSYHRLLLFFKGERGAEALLAGAGAEESGLDLATVAYGIGAWHLAHGRRQAAQALFQKVLAGEQWPAFGYIAAEAELARAAGGSVLP